MAEINSVIKNAKYNEYDEAGARWITYHFETGASQTKCEDGISVEEKIGTVKGVTTSTSITTDGYLPDATITTALRSDVDTNISDISELKTKADTASANITKNASDISNLKTQVETNKTNLVNLNAAATSNTLDIASLKQQVNTNKNDISNLSSAISTNADGIQKNSDRIDSLSADTTAKLLQLEAMVQELQSKFDELAGIRNN